MIDPRFYEHLGPRSLSEIARIVGAPVPDGFDAELSIKTCGAIGDVGAQGIVYFKGNAPSQSVANSLVTNGVACLVRASSQHVLPAHVAPLVVMSARAAFSTVASVLIKRRDINSNSPPIDPSSTIEPGVSLGHSVVIGAGAGIGSGTSIGSNTVIGPGVAIGRNCKIGSNVTIYCAYIGDRVTISSNSVIGETGFGVEITSDGPVDVPQLGRVILQDDVSIGSLCAVDRGAFGDTVLGIGCKIDNFTQIAHNCQLGRGVVIAAFGGISGSCIIGDGVMMGGRVGMADHINIGAGATLSAAACVFRDVPAGESWGGMPAQPIKQWHREVIALKKLARRKPAPAAGGRDPK